MKNNEDELEVEGESKDNVDENFPSLKEQIKQLQQNFFRDLVSANKISEAIKLLVEKNLNPNAVNEFD